MANFPGYCSSVSLIIFRDRVEFFYYSQHLKRFLTRDVSRDFNGGEVVMEGLLDEGVLVIELFYFARQ